MIALLSTNQPEFGLSREQEIVVDRNRRLLRLVAVGNQATQNVDKAVHRRAMTRMLNLLNVLQLINNRFV